MKRSRSQNESMITQSMNLEGQFLVAMPNMGDVRFENTIIFICAHSDEGAMGFIVNKSLNEPSTGDFLLRLGIISEASKQSVPGSVLDSELNSGGPVEPGRGFVLHSPDFSSPSTLSVTEDISLTATLEILRDLSVGKGPEKFFLALGYSGWGAGQLESEIASNGWLTCEHSPDIIYSRDNETKYQRIMQSMGIDPSLISIDTGHA